MLASVLDIFGARGSTKPEYCIKRDGDKLVAIDSKEETVGVYDSEEEAQAEIAREKKEGII